MSPVSGRMSLISGLTSTQSLFPIYSKFSPNFWNCIPLPSFRLPTRHSPVRFCLPLFGNSAVTSLLLSEYGRLYSFAVRLVLWPQVRYRDYWVSSRDWQEARSMMFGRLSWFRHCMSLCPCKCDCIVQLMWLIKRAVK